jgi:hypothetical protein
MPPKPTNQPHRAAGHILYLMVTLLSVFLSGCVWNTSWLRREPVSRLPNDLTKTELVAYLNDNIERVGSWRSTNVRISAKGPGVLSIPLSGTIAVKNPRNFRLTVDSSIFGREADFGSNSEKLWIWMRRGDVKEIVTCRHDQIEHLQNRLPIPFQPDWMMEALGVIPIDEAEMTMLPPDSQTSLIRLISMQSVPRRRPVQRIIFVDPVKGQIVAHSLQDERGKMIALAELDDYRYDTKNGASLAHRVKLDWPERGVKMTLRFDEIEVNPSRLPQQTWQMPQGLPVYNVGNQRPYVSGNESESPGRIRLGPSSNNPVRFADNKSPFGSEGSSFSDFTSHSQFVPPTQSDDQPQFDDEPFDHAPQFDDEEPNWDDEPASNRNSSGVSINGSR